jgi:hypothetical protein
MKLINSILLFASLILGCGSVLLAQQKGQSVSGQIGPNASAVSDPGVTSVNSSVTPTLATNGEPRAAGQSAAPGSGIDLSGTEDDDQWHFTVSPYLWFPWVHGTVGAFGHDASFSVTPSDLLSHARFGLLGAVEARRNRILSPIDMIWLRLKATQALPFPGQFATSANVTANVFILTPKVGFRVINQDRFKADFLTGVRYFYFGQSLNFSPSRLGLNFSKSQNWVDPLVGGRIQASFSPKTMVTIAGDVGGWGTGSQIDYQVVGLLGYKVKPNWTLQGGYRYLYFDRERGGPAGATANLAMSGIVLGVTMNLR